MRKKLDTRFPAPRIKKIMQADEDVGKIAMAVPLLVSKALELFLQDLCDRTYEITVKKGAKTVNSLHLKECVHGCNVFDFLRDTVSNVPDLGASDAASEDTSTTKRRKISEGECGNGNEFARMYMQETGHTSNTGRGRARGRARGRGRGSRTLQRESFPQHEKFEDDRNISDQIIESQQEHEESLNTDARTTDGKETDKSVMNFDLNVDLNESMDSTEKFVDVPVSSPMKLSPHAKPEDVPGWSVEDMAMMAINPVQLANINKGMDEEPEDYDAEG